MSDVFGQGGLDIETPSSEWFVQVLTRMFWGYLAICSRRAASPNNVATTLRFTYDKAGRLTSMIYPGGAVADYMGDAQDPRYG